MFIENLERVEMRLAAQDESIAQYCLSAGIPVRCKGHAFHIKSWRVVLDEVGQELQASI